MKLAGLLILLGVMNATAQDNYNLVIGTYTDTCQSKGIYVYDFNVATGDFKPKGNTEEVVNPSYLTVSADNKFIYSVNENGDDSDISAFKYEPAKGKVTKLNKRNSKGEDPCFILNDGENVIVDNYGSGSISVYHKKKDGSLTEARQVIKHTGGSVNKERQEGPHVHQVRLTADKKYLFATDLGNDKIYIYNYNPTGDDETLKLNQTVNVKPGTGPRHLTIHPNSIFFYLVGELDASVTVFSFINGKVEEIQRKSLIPVGFTGENGGGDIHFSKDGKYLYVTNRGTANTITTFRVHSNGMINQVQQISTLGDGPRHFAIGPKDNYLLVGHEKSNSITIFKRDKNTGMLTDTGKKIELCSPVCLVFTPIKNL
jgi:6-phosphogluconolactonase